MWIMTRHASMLACVLLAASLVGCGGGTGGGSVSPLPVPQDIPTLTAIAPSSAPAGGSALNLVLFGSNFENGAAVQWNGTALSSSWVSATQMTATIPASNFKKIVMGLRGSAPKSYAVVVAPISFATHFSHGD